MSKIHPHTLILVVELILILSGCASPPTKGIVGKSNYDTLVLDFEADHTRAQPGIPIQLRFAVKNTGERIWILDSQDSPVMDIIVSPMGSSEILLTWSAQNPDKVAHRLEWKPGESKVIELVWIPKQEDVHIGVIHDIHFSGVLNRDSKQIQAAGVTLCASNVCR